MKRYILILLLSFCASVQAQNLRTLFMSAPDEVLPLLPANARADCLDYFDAGMEARVMNSLDGTSVMTVLTDDYLFLQTTSSSSVQMKLLPCADGGSLVCVIKSVKAEAENSHVAFYDLEWNRVPGEQLYVAPAIADFFISVDSAARYIDKCDMYLVRCILADNDATLTAEYTMPAYMDINDSELIAPLLRKIVYLWDGTRFVVRE